MKQAILEIIKNIDKIKSERDLSVWKRAWSKKHDLPLPLNSDLLREYFPLLSSGQISSAWQRKHHVFFLSLLKKRAVRTLSGVAPLAVLTKPYTCPGSCVYCPKIDRVPASYLPNEPAVMRALRLNFNPYLQVVYRLKALENNGHEPNKIELIVIGGTWSYLDRRYKYWYLLNCFKAVNDFSRIKNRLVMNRGEASVSFDYFKRFTYSHHLKLSDLKKYLVREQKKNTKAKYQIIGLSVETRPDYINERELRELRELGVTRVEMGLQAIDDKILKLNRRGHDVSASIVASEKLKKFGFKTTYHFMPALPGSSPAKDINMFKQIYADARFRPDQIKFYPTTVVKNSLLFKWWRQGRYRPYQARQLEQVIIECKKIVPPYTRIMRLVRDIPGESIEAGNTVTNLRQIMKSKGLACRCIRCRESGSRTIDRKNLKLNVLKYESSGGQEYFISFDSRDGNILYGFCRLRIDRFSPVAPALIRELHVYGQLVPIGGTKKVQHSGLGKKLMARAEKIAQKNGLDRIAVISGVGVRAYYRKLGYRLRATYMVKKLK